MKTGRIHRPPTEPQLILPRVGILRTGYKDGNGLPRSCDYFIASGRYAGLFTDAYGKQPNRVHVVFMDDDPANVCIERYEYWDKDARLFAFGDGRTFEVWTAKEEKYTPFSVVDRPEIMDEVARKCPNKNGWEVTLTLRFLLPKVKGIGGLWEYHTKAVATSIPSIVGTFDSVKNMRGFVKGLIFDLVVEFAKSHKPGKKSKYPVVNLVLNHSEESMATMQNAIVAPSQPLLPGHELH